MIVDLKISESNMAELCEISAKRGKDISQIISGAVESYLKWMASQATKRPSKDDFGAPVHKAYKRPPSIGSVFMSQNQKFEVFRCDRDQSAYGEPFLAVTWESSCAKCGDLFYQETGLKVGTLERRCKKHKMSKIP